MAASSDLQLHQLYLELGEAHASRHRSHEAADAYALSMYYARRVGDDLRVRRCRELIAACNPNHVSVQTTSAPLFFAQLLMRYPADEVERTLAALKTDRAAGGTATLAHPELPPLPAYRGYRGGDYAAPNRPVAVAVENHHALELHDASVRRPRAGAVDDLVLGDADWPARSPRLELPTPIQKVINFFSLMTILGCMGLIGFFGYTLFPVLWTLNVDRMVGRFLGEERDATPLAPLNLIDPEQADAAAPKPAGPHSAAEPARVAVGKANTPAAPRR